MKFLITLILALTCLTGCISPHEHINKPLPETAMNKPMVMSDVDFILCLFTNRFHVSDCRVITNERYLIPTKKWFENEFPTILKEFQFYVKQGSYKAESNDCDNFSKVAVVAARLWNYHTNGASDASIAVGEFYYTRWTGEKHAIICALVRVDIGRYKLAFLEPQTCEIIYLSKEEMESCSHQIF